MANTGWGSDSKPAHPSRSSGWSQDNLADKKPATPVLKGLEKPPITEKDFIDKHRSSIVEIFGEDFQKDPRYKLALAQVLEGKRAVHMILADYRARDTGTGGGGW